MRSNPIRFLVVAALALGLAGCSSDPDGAGASGAGGPGDGGDDGVGGAATTGSAATGTTSSVTGGSGTGGAGGDVTAGGEGGDVTAGGGDGGAGGAGGADAGAGGAGGDEGCSGPTCGVEMVAPMPQEGDRATTLLADATHLYFSSHMDGYVFRVAKEGGDVETLLSRGWGVPFMADGGDVLYVLVRQGNDYWVDEVPKVGGVPTELFRSPAQSSNIDYDNLVVDEARVYISSGTNGGGPSTLRVIDRATREVSILYPEDIHLARRLALVGDDLYWKKGSRLHRAPTSGATEPVDLGVFAALGQHLTAHEGALYTVAETSIQVTRIDVDESVTQLTEEPPSARDTSPPVLDATHVYLRDRTNVDKGNYYRVPRAGGPAEVFATDQGSPGIGIAVDDTHVYWSAFLDGQYGILRKAK